MAKKKIPTVEEVRNMSAERKQNEKYGLNDNGMEIFDEKSAGLSGS